VLFYRIYHDSANLSCLTGMCCTSWRIAPTGPDISQASTTTTWLLLAEWTVVMRSNLLIDTIMQISHLKFDLVNTL
jgi:hypothetical protein